MRPFLSLLIWSLFASGTEPFNYAEALQKSIYFFECQRSGPLPANNRVEWRGPSALDDGKDVGVDLTGGWYDAGDHVKFGLPAAGAQTLLAWSVIEYRDGFERAGQLPFILESLRWEADFLIKCHIAPNEFYGQVGKGDEDHRWWGAPEVMQMPRPAYKIDKDHPGSDLAAEAAAALAATSMVFQKTDSTYAAKCLAHALQLREFASTCRGKYSDSITDAKNFYNSFSGFQDELVWSAAWLHYATKDPAWLQEAERDYEKLPSQPQTNLRSYKWTQNWDDKCYGCYVLLAKLTGKPIYKEDAERWLDWWSVGYKNEHVKYTPGGLAWLEQWGALRYAANTSFLALIYSDACTDPMHKARYHDFATRQIDYILGKNPTERSYVIGFGNNPPRNPHHRGAHGTWLDNLQGEPAESRHTLYGALVGGPDANDSYTDSRGDYVKNEVALDYNAAFTGALARMAREFGGTPLKDFPPKEKRDDEFFVQAKINASGPRFIEISALLNNRSAWPARVSKKLSFRYFFDLSEAFAAGHSLAQITATSAYSQGSGISPITQWAGNIYFVELHFEKEPPYPGGQQHYKKEVQFRLSLPSNSDKREWDNSNDWSFAGLSNSEHTKSANIPVYDDDKLIFGAEPPRDGRPIPPVKPVATSKEPTKPAEPPKPADTAKPAAPKPASPALPPLAGAIQVHYKNTEPNASSNQMRAHLKLVNTDKTPVALSDLTIRYWLKDGGAPMAFWCDYSPAGAENISGKFVKLPTPRSGAESYLEIAFTDDAGNLAKGKDIELQTRAAKKDWSPLNQSEDFSFDASKTDYAQAPRITLYLKGKLIWGSEPPAPK